MVQISNNVLAALLLIAIAISGMGIFTIVTITTPGPKVTGFNVGTGLTNVTILQLASITLLRNVSYFGTGAPGSDILHLYSNSTNTNGFFNGSEGNGTDYGTGTFVYPFVVANDGNVDSTCVKISAASNAAGFIGGTNPEFHAAAQDNETASCGGTLHSEWQSVSGADITMCDSLHTEAGGSGSNTVRIHWHLGIPKTAEGAKTNTITVTGGSSC
jgi:hypothetical protein